MTPSNIPRRQFVKNSMLSLAALGTACHLKQEKKPNIICIMTDDQGWGDLGIHGNPYVRTPTLDKLALSGARLNRFYVSPVCAPTRASLLTGRYHPRTGTHGVTRREEMMRLDETTIAQTLQSHGYATGCFGKWHNGAHYPYHPNGKGFDEFFGFCAGHWNNYFNTSLEHNGQEVKTRGYIADVITDEAINFINTHRDRPFFCYIPYNTPHSPFQVPQSCFEKYKSMRLDDLTASVYAMCENIDDNVSRILDTLNSLQLEEDTIVVFLCDNGPNSDRYNGNMRGRKGSLHEGGVRVPFFIRWTGHIEPGLVLDELTAHIDLLPTILRLCKIPLPGKDIIDGKDLSPLLLQKSSTWPDRMIFHNWRQRGAVRTNRYRLVVDNEKTELYDMLTDPQEKQDISTLNPQKTASLKKAYDEWLAEVTKNGYDSLPIPIGYEERPFVELPAHEAILLKTSEKTGISYNDRQGWANDWVTNWTDIRAYPWWPVDIMEDGFYEISLKYTCPATDIGSRIRIEIGQSILEGRITRAYDPPVKPSPDRIPRKEVYEKSWAHLNLGALFLKKGQKHLIVRALSRPGNQVMELKSVIVQRREKI
ncbi:sulfatase-like hydrolase/transferase [candidate division KSB1 bacterium]|nr:sulfatase-like hydrolase/transferase [candidate division KSB1 bacterium]